MRLLGGLGIAVYSIEERSIIKRTKGTWVLAFPTKSEINLNLSLYSLGKCDSFYKQG